MSSITLGDEVEDTVTGFRGMAIGRHVFLHGTTNITVQPVVEHYGSLYESEIFAETQLKIIKTRGGNKKGPVIVK